MWAIVTYKYRRNKEHRAIMRYRAKTHVKDYLTTEMAPPRAVGETTTVPRKSRSRAPTNEPDMEETLGTRCLSQAFSFFT
jgi:hypothetical protein